MRINIYNYTPWKVEFNISGYRTNKHFSTMISFSVYLDFPKNAKQAINIISSLWTPSIVISSELNQKKMEAEKMFKKSSHCYHYKQHQNSKHSYITVKKYVGRLYSFLLFSLKEDFFTYVFVENCQRKLNLLLLKISFSLHFFL